MYLLLVYDDEEEVSYTGQKGWWFFLGSFYCSPSLVAQLSKSEITLCIGNTHVLKLFSFD